MDSPPSGDSGGCAPARFSVGGFLLWLHGSGRSGDESRAQVAPYFAAPGTASSVRLSFPTAPTRSIPCYGWDLLCCFVLWLLCKARKWRKRESACSPFCSSVAQLAMLLQILPVSIKSLAGSFATLANWLTSFGITMTANLLISWIAGGTFASYMIVSAFTLVFVIVWVPETKGRTLEEIQWSFR